MRRLNEKELDVRIQKFLFRKSKQFPELESAAVDRTDRSWASNQRQEEPYKKPTIRWSLQLS